MIPGTAGMLPTIATATQVGTTGAGAGITTDGTIHGTTEDTTEAIMAAITAGTTRDSGLLRAATWDSVPQPTAAERLAEEQAMDA